MTTGSEKPDAITDIVNSNRVLVGGVVLAVAIASLVAGGYCLVRFVQNATAEKADAASELVRSTVTSLDQPAYFVGFLTGFTAALGLGIVGAFFMATLPSPDVAKRRRLDRTLILIGAGIFGAVNILCGLFLFIHWFDKVTDWAAGRTTGLKQAWYPVAAMLQLLGGALIVFLGLIPARAEERNNTALRRTVYISNLALTITMVFIGLVVFNILVSLKFPAKLDTTETGFYSLSEQTTAYIAELKQDVQVYLITSEGGTQLERIQQDAQRLLEACTSINPQKFKVRLLSPVLNRKDIDDLTAKYKDANLREFGMLITTSANPDTASFIEIEKMVSRAGGKMAFKGEAELYRELKFRTEKESVVYFTQGAREFTVFRSNDPNAVAGRLATRLADDLTLARCVAKPLMLNPLDVEPTIPDDADAVVVLDPLVPLSAPTATALGKYLKLKKPNGNTGRLIVFAAGHAGPGGKGIATTGLEELLQANGIGTEEGVFYTVPVGKRNADTIEVFPNPESLRSRIPMALAAAQGFSATHARYFGPMPTQPNAPASARAIFLTGGATTWIEREIVTPPNKAFTDLKAANDRRDRAYLTMRNVVGADSLLPVGVATNSKDLLVYGFADGLGDDAPRSEEGRSAMSRVLTASLDWSLARPATDIAAKNYSEYTPQKNLSELKLFWVPAIGVPFTILMLGLGVWVARRR